MGHVPYEWVMSHVPYEWVMSHMNESCPIWLSHVPYEWVMSHMNESCPICMSRVPRERARFDVPPVSWHCSLVHRTHTHTSYSRYHNNSVWPLAAGFISIQFECEFSLSLVWAYFGHHTSLSDLSQLLDMSRLSLSVSLVWLWFSNRRVCLTSRSCMRLFSFWVRV